MNYSLELENQTQVFKWAELIVNNSSDGIISIDHNYVIRFFNNGAEKIFNYLSKEVLGKHINILIPPRFAEIHNNHLNEFANSPVVARQKDKRTEVCGIRKDGREIILEASISKFVYDGNLIFTVIFRDVTERKAHEKTLRDFQYNLEREVEKIKQELLQENVSLQREIINRNQVEVKTRNLFAAVEQTIESIIILDRKGFIEYTNPTFEIITGFKKEEVHNSRVRYLGVGPVSLNDYKKIVKTLIKQDKWQGIYLAKKKDGTFYEEEATILAIKDSNNSVINYVAVCRDVSEQKRLESIVNSVDMMKNVGYVFAGIRHELGNPINSIKTSLSVLKKGLTSYSYESISVYIERALVEITRVEYLLKALKSFSMFEKLKLERVNLVSFIKNFYCLAKEDCEKKGITLNFNYTNNEMFVLIDPRAFHQVMLNIFSNAVDALEQRVNSTIDISLSFDARFIKLEISDNGIGLTNSQKEKLFKPFHTFKTQGTGLGLVITKKLVNNMQGTIEIDSSYNSGTKIIIILNNIM